MPLSLGIASGAAWLKNPAEPGPLGYRVNLIKNPSAEVNTSGWVAGAGATVTRTTSENYTGTAALQVVTTASSYVQWGSALAGSRIPYVGAGTYSFSVYVKAAVGAAAANYSLRFYEYETETSGSTVASGVMVTTTVADGDGWVRISGTWTKATIANYVILRLNTSSSVSGNTFYADAFLLEYRNVVGSYFDGDTGFWTGTPHDSISGGTPY